MDSRGLRVSLVIGWFLTVWFAYSLGFNRGQAYFAAHVHWTPLPVGGRGE